MGRATVHDLARTAGVSLATVDRVLNRRGGVRAATIEKVAQAVDRLDYRRDAAAATLAKQREYQFAFVIPTGVNAFLASLALEVRKLADVLRSERVFLSIVEVPPFDGEALVEALDRLRNQLRAASAWSRWSPTRRARGARIMSASTTAPPAAPPRR